MGRRIQQSTSTRSQAASARSELGPTTLTSRSMRLLPVRARGRARGRRLHMSKRSQQLANPTGRQENAFTRLCDSSSASSPTIATTDDQSNVATRSVTSSTKAQQPDANNTPTPVDYSSLTVKNLKSILRDRGLQVSGRKADLVQRLEEHDALNQVGARGLGHDVAPVGTQWKEQKWGDSFAKAYLKKSLLDDKFIANLENLKEALRIERERVAQEEKEFLREQRNGMTLKATVAVSPLRALSIGKDMSLNFLFLTGKKAIGDPGYSDIDNVTITREGHSREVRASIELLPAPSELLQHRVGLDTLQRMLYMEGGRLGTRWQTQRQYELRALIVAASDTDLAHGHPYRKTARSKTKKTKKSEEQKSRSAWSVSIETQRIRTSEALFALVIAATMIREGRLTYMPAPNHAPPQRHAQVHHFQSAPYTVKNITAYHNESDDRLATLGAGLTLRLRLGRTPCVRASSTSRVQLENSPTRGRGDLRSLTLNFYPLAELSWRPVQLAAGATYAVRLKTLSAVRVQLETSPPCGRGNLRSLTQNIR
ncbi:hypothetical protein THAOC_10957 [Thalassiosira oceanica]|uniref:SAP domain-containing protein n=1 Tax=Thalassiosira oceanica TaxID=159749 RepID=K0SNQ6_THAOC|nr:hypothetical protein THAOC_10957 [Thalassiosira oceanica]|eukprot:EJK67928.1 hypothetical protein THAOC_10957 [Thalassiosira oceanica]